MQDRDIEFPVRINRYLALKNFCTRRQGDEWIKQGRILVNGKPADVGMQIGEDDKVQVLAKQLAEAAKDRVYYAFNKPKGVLSHGPRADGDKMIEDFTLNLKKTVFPVGRLDKESHGLVILTNDGRVTEKLLSPKYNHEKEYKVRVNKPVSQNFITRMMKGIKLEDGYITKPAFMKADVGAKSFSIVITEGKKHQIRRMCTALGFEVKDLERIRVGNIKISGLKAGELKMIQGKELKVFLKSLGMVK